MAGEHYSANSTKEEISSPKNLDGNEQVSNTPTKLPSEAEHWKTSRLHEIKEELSDTLTDQRANFDNGNSQSTLLAEDLVDYDASGTEIAKPMAVPPYTQSAQEELQLLVKYLGIKQRTKQMKGDDIRAEALEILHTVSTLLRKYYLCEDAAKVSKATSNIVVLPSCRPRPYRYQKYVQDSLAQLHLDLPLEPIKLSHGGSLASCKSSEQIRFLNLKCSHMNEVLYRNDSRNLERDYSSFNFPVMTETYLSLRNLYSHCHLDRAYRSATKSANTLGVRFNSFLDFKISDEEYKLWLKQNNFTKYSKLTVTTDESGRTPEDLVHLSVSQTDGILKEPTARDHSKYRLDGRERKSSSRDCCFSSFHQMIIYEHVVISNFIHFFSCYFFTKRLKKLTICDRIGQVVFFIMSYYVIVLLSKSGVQDIGSTLNFKDIFQ